MTNAEHNEPTIVAIIPAAGRSQRMGRPKPLVPIDGRPMLLATIEPFLATPGVHVVVVTRSHIAEALDLEAIGAQVVCNDDDSTEMIDSIRRAIGAAQQRIAAILGWMVTPGDQPGIGPADVQRCADAVRADPSRIVIATHGGRRGHPVIIPWGLTPEIFAELCDPGLNQLVKRYADRVTPVACASPGVTGNINTPADLPPAGAQEQEPDA